MTAPWSTIPVTGAQHDAWLAQERERDAWPAWVTLAGSDGDAADASVTAEELRCHAAKR